MHVTRAERNATLLGLACIVLILLFRFYLQHKPEQIHTEQYAYLKQLLSTEVLPQDSADALYAPIPKTRTYHFAETKAPPQTFTDPETIFDPDTISTKQWIAWGIPVFVADRMEKYRQKGGHLRNADDLARIYGFPEDRLQKIAPFIAVGEYPERKDASTVISTPEHKQYAGPVIALHTASEADLMNIGFTQNEAKRILRFRDQAGGFFSTEQLYGIYGIDATHIQSAIPWLEVNDKMVILINLNTTDSVTLAAHVYISDDLAGEIIQYRNKTGKFYSVQELTKVKGMYPSLFEKLKPYLRI